LKQTPCVLHVRTTDGRWEVRWHHWIRRHTVVRKHDHGPLALRGTPTLRINNG